VKRLVLLAVVATGCSAIYDAQYTDRENQLDESRTLFLDGSTNIQFLGAGEHRVYWLDVPQVLEMPELHSVDARGSAQIDYPWSENMSAATVATFGLGDQLVVPCGTGQAFDAGVAGEAATPYATIDTSVFAENSSSGTLCVVAGGSAYFVTPNAPTGVEAWQPSAGSNVATVFALGSINPNPNGFGFATGSNMLYQEGENLWLLSLASGAMPPGPLNGAANGVAAGTIAFDDEGVSYIETAGDLVYLRYSQAGFDPAPVTSVADMVSAGGYSINFDHADAQDLLSSGNYIMFQHHLIYEANDGIFALGMDTGNVIDLLLDGLADSDGDQSPQYRNPVITDDGTLFVEDVSDSESSVVPVYSVDLNGRLK
jgi:hypothetical protein